MAPSFPPPGRKICRIRSFSSRFGKGLRVPQFRPMRSKNLLHWTPHAPRPNVSTVVNGREVCHVRARLDDRFFSGGIAAPANQISRFFSGPRRLPSSSLRRFGFFRFQLPQAPFSGRKNCGLVFPRGSRVEVGKRPAPRLKLRPRAGPLALPVRQSCSAKKNEFSKQGR